MMDQCAKLLKPYKAFIDSRGVVSFPKCKQFPILETDVDIVLNWLDQRIDFGESRSSYAIQQEIQYFSHHLVSNGAVIMVMIGLGNVFELDQMAMEITFPNRLLRCPIDIKLPNFENLFLIQGNFAFKKLSALQKKELVTIVQKEWKKEQFGFNGNLDEIMPNPYLVGLFCHNHFVGFMVATSQFDLTPLYFEIFPEFRKLYYASTFVKMLDFEMSGHLSILQTIEPALHFWLKMGYKKLNGSSTSLAKIC
jgi:hypothetical protein